jgi:hypothetical protein
MLQHVGASTLVHIARSTPPELLEGLGARLDAAMVLAVVRTLFADQPDNCAHAADKGYAVQLALGGLTPSAFAGSLLGLLLPAAQPALQAALQDAWVRNVAAGGAARAVGIIEAAAALPYGAHLGEVPVDFFLPWHQRWGVDVCAAALLALLALSWACGRACRLARACCRGPAAKAKAQ